MDKIQPRFIVLNKDDRKRGEISATVRRHNPKATIIESSTPRTLGELLDADREKGGDWAKPSPTILLTDVAAAANTLVQHQDQIGPFISAGVRGFGLDNRFSPLTDTDEPQRENLSSNRGTATYYDGAFTKRNVADLVGYLAKVMAL